MHPSPSFTAIVPQTFEGHIIHAITMNGAPLVAIGEQARAMGYDNPRRLTDLLTEMTARREAEEGEDFFRFRGETLKDMRNFVDDFNRSANPGGKAADLVSPMAREMIFLTREGAILLAMRSDAPRAAGFRKWAKKVLVTVIETGRYEEGPRTVLPTVRDITGLLAELRRNKVPTTTIHGVTANLLSQIGIEFVPAASKPATAQLSLLLPPAAPAEPAPTPTSPRPKWLRDAPPADGNDWPGLVRAWLSKYGLGAIVTSADLLQLGIVVPDSPNDAGRASKLGRALHKRIDTVIAGCRITRRNSTVRGYALQKA